jgi:hypothetical protein
MMELTMKESNYRLENYTFFISKSKFYLTFTVRLDHVFWVAFVAMYHSVPSCIVLQRYIEVQNRLLLDN